ncbi:hypothetical protein K0M31_003867, partial [Melipona bicolor]
RRESDLAAIKFPSMQPAAFSANAPRGYGVSKGRAFYNDTSLCSGAFSGVGSFIGRLVNFGAAIPQSLDPRCN